jgi:hypothetical protein
MNVDHKILVSFKQIIEISDFAMVKVKKLSHIFIADGLTNADKIHKMVLLNLTQNVLRMTQYLGRFILCLEQRMKHFTSLASDEELADANLVTTISHSFHICIIYTKFAWSALATP